MKIKISKEKSCAIQTKKKRKRISMNTELRTPFIFLSNTHLFKGTEGHFYQFWKKHLIFWVITNCTFVLFQGKAFNFLSNYK